MFRISTGLLAAGLALSVAQAQQALEYPSYRVADAPPQFHEAIQQGDIVIASLQNAVLMELTRELDRSGPSGAIKSCHIDADAAIGRTAREEGVAAGRTSDRLRVPTNAPRPWAATLVQRYRGQQAAGVDGWVVDLGNRVGLLRPIAHRALCEGCHGDRAKMSAAVLAELSDRYPADRATGFRNGELRGWFWVEVPKK